MHYSSAHHPWRPRGGPWAAEKEMHPPPLPPPEPRPDHPPPPSPRQAPVPPGGLTEGLQAGFDPVQFPKDSKIYPIAHIPENPHG